MAEVKMFAWAGLVSAPVVSGTRYATDSVQMFKHPYLGSERLVANTSSAVSSDAASAPDNTNIALIQIEPGKRVTYEITPGGHTLKTATINSPTIQGDVTLHFGPGWRISVLEVA